MRACLVPDNLCLLFHPLEQLPHSRYRQCSDRLNRGRMRRNFRKHVQIVWNMLQMNTNVSWNNAGYNSKSWEWPSVTRTVAMLFFKGENSQWWTSIRHRTLLKWLDQPLQAASNMLFNIRVLNLLFSNKKNKKKKVKEVKQSFLQVQFHFRSQSPWVCIWNIDSLPIQISRI